MRLRQLSVSMMLTAVVAGCGDDPPTRIQDTTPPARITDLAIGNGPGGSFLSWTAPGDDDTTGTVSDYDIRYINGDILAQWADAISLPSPESLVPAGQTQTAPMDSLGPGVWQFGVRAADEVPNWSDVSNVASVTITTPANEDTTPPAAVTDLAAGAVLGGVRLQWTAPGDDGLSGTAAVYDLRFAHEVITPQSWADATPVEGVGAPKTSGETETTTVPGLQGGQEYSFALRSADEAGNWSGLSNAATVFLPWSSPTQVTFSNCFGAGSPSWSPGGSSIACAYGVPGGFSCVNQVFVVALNGGNPRQYTFSSYQAQAPAWSPDGTHFALAEKDDDPSNYRLSVMEATPRASMTILASHSGLNVASPRWSPDGTRIAYRAIGGTPPSNLVTTLYSIPSDGGTPTYLAGPLSSNTGLSWSPDGTTIAFDSRESGSSDIWIMPSTGGVATRVTMGTGGEYTPSWSPDGSVIAYIQIAEGQISGQIWGIAPTGGPPFLLVNDTEVITGSLAWSPDGRSLAYVKGSPPRNIWVASVNAQE